MIAKFHENQMKLAKSMQRKSDRFKVTFTCAIETDCIAALVTGVSERSDHIYRHLGIKGSYLTLIMYRYDHVTLSKKR